MQRQRLGRFGPQLSALGLRWPSPLVPEVNWLVVDVSNPVDLVAPDGWAVVLLGSGAAPVRRALAGLGRDVADVVVARDIDEWPAAVALAGAGLARCVGVATDDALVVETCRWRHHVDAVWSTEPDDALVRVCRWGGTGILRAADALTADQAAALR